MKTVKITIIIVLMNLTINAQTQLWSMGQLGGIYGSGTIFKMNLNGSNYTPVYNFVNADGTFPEGSLIQATNGLLYGMAEEGGTNGYGALFSFDPVSNTYIDLINFNDSVNGKLPFGSLFQSNNGKLYGIVGEGGSNNFGVIFNYDISLNTLTKLYDFDSINGSYSASTFIQGINGKLYGMTGEGGVNNFGVIFSFDPLSNAYVNIHSFDSIHGSTPQGNLFLDTSNGLLYGLTKFGGINNDGVIFSIDTNNSYNVLYNFNDTIGKYPCGNLIINPMNGKLYGLTVGGGTNEDGVLFNFDLNTNTYSDLIDFNGSGNGENPVGSLFLASNGLIYGMAVNGGTNNNGVIFSFNPVDSTYTKLRDLSNSDGISPVANFIEIPSNVGIPIIKPSINDIPVYPNPFLTSTTFYINGASNQNDYHLYIYNLLGQEVRSIYVGSSKEVVISREDLPSGMYFYKLIDDKGNLSTGKLMIAD